jgi:hypothetical protein
MLGCQVRLLCHGLLTRQGNRDLIRKWIKTRRYVFVLFFYYGNKIKEAWKFHNVKAFVAKAEGLQVQTMYNGINYSTQYEKLLIWK